MAIWWGSLRIGIYRKPQLPMPLAWTFTKSITKLADIIHKYNGRLISLYSTYEGAPPGTRHVYLRAYQIDRQKLSELLEELKKETTLLYMVDHQTGKRDMLHIYQLLKTIRC